jgi:hypothetical protein
VVRRFSFPAWHLHTADSVAPIRAEPFGPGRLLAFPIAAGEREYELAWRLPAPLPSVDAASLLAWMAWLGSVVALAARRRRGAAPRIGGTSPIA